MLTFYYHNDTLPTELKTLLKQTLEMCIRPEVQSDSSFIQLVLRERSSEKRALPTEEEPPQNQNLADINNRLDDFLLDVFSYTMYLPFPNPVVYLLLPSKAVAFLVVS